MESLQSEKNYLLKQTIMLHNYTQPAESPKAELSSMPFYMNEVVQELWTSTNTLIAESASVLPHNDDLSLAWAAAHLQELLDKYRGSWILINDADVVDASEDLADLLRRASDRGIQRPLILKMEEPSPAWRTAYTLYAA